MPRVWSSCAGFTKAGRCSEDQGMEPTVAAVTRIPGATGTPFSRAITLVRYLSDASIRAGGAEPV